MVNYCDNCGKQINPDDSFCNNCGTQISDSKRGEASRINTPRQITTQPKLYRSVDDRWIAGVCGGLGKHFNIDPILIRIANSFYPWNDGWNGISYLYNSSYFH
ncbi:MAG: PspC domain-containing protein [Candidatus Hodarchaeales archaeon]